MTNISSEKARVNYSAEKVFEFVGNFDNFKELLPEDRVENYQCTEDSCSFRIKGMTDLGLRIEEREKPGKIVMKSDGKVPFAFTMQVNFETIDENSCDASIDFEGDINPFMKMMVEKPLTNFFNMLVNRLAELKLD